MFCFLLLLVHITLACDPQRVHGSRPSEGLLSSPSYPLTYPPNSDCLYNITAEPELVIHISFTHFELEEHLPRSNQCLNDYIIITVTDRQGKSHIGNRYCGVSLPPSIRTMQHSLSLLFHSSHTNEYSGFQLQYEFLLEESIMEPPSSYYDGDKRFRKQCGGRNVKNSLDGEIVSPGYPTTYPRNASCYWLIRVTPNKKIYIRLQYLHLSSNMADCDKASLYIIDGYQEPDYATYRDDNLLHVHFCGNQDYYSEEGMKSYIFVSSDDPSTELLEKYDKVGQPIGFRLLWTEVEEILSEEQTCPGFACRGGDLCVDNGRSVCGSRSQLCINDSLMCNGVSNCVENDNSDEEHCYSQHILLVACSTIILLLMIIFGVISWQKYQIRTFIKRYNTKQKSRPVEQKNGREDSAIWKTDQCDLLHSTPSSFQAKDKNRKNAHELLMLHSELL